MKSDTPLTDEAAFDADNWNEVVASDFARSLERANARLRAALQYIVDNERFWISGKPYAVELNILMKAKTALAAEVGR